MAGTIQDLLIAAVAFVLVLSVVVFVHEYGHFRVGRWCGIRVKSFSIGLGSEWIGWTDKHGTRWKISRLPLGGFVSWVDDTDGSSTLPASEEHRELSDEEARQRGHFRAQPLWKRAVTVAAGPLTNFVFAIATFALIAFIVGRDTTDYASLSPRIGGVQTDSAASEAGLRSGDLILRVDEQSVATWGAFHTTVSSSPNEALSLTVENAGERRSVTVTPRLVERPSPSGVERVGVIGVSLGVLDSDRTVEAVGPIEALGVGARNTWAIVSSTASYVAGIFTGHNSGRDIAGPIGIFTQSGQIATMALDGVEDDLLAKAASLLRALALWAAVLSVAVGIVNLLPIPILDGGHLLFYAIEAVRGGRPLPAAAQEWAYRAGLAVMASLFLFATWNDITRLFPGAH
ncbi:MAG: RIP metalloprotease [Hyphomonadaceae bacterium]|nr:RIP metalloprotease [Hyphomonadaceae bacterium]